MEPRERLAELAARALVEEGYELGTDTESEMVWHMAEYSEDSENIPCDAGGHYRSDTYYGRFDMVEVFHPNRQGYALFATVEVNYWTSDGDFVDWSREEPVIDCVTIPCLVCDGEVCLDVIDQEELGKWMEGTPLGMCTPFGPDDMISARHCICKDCREEGD